MGIKVVIAHQFESHTGVVLSARELPVYVLLLPAKHKQTTSISTSFSFFTYVTFWQNTFDCIISGVLFIVVIHTPPAAQAVSTPVLRGIYRQKQHSLVHPGSSLTEESSAGCPPLPEDGAVLCVDLFQHAVVPQVLLTPSTAERFHKLLLRDLRDRNVFVNSAFNLREILHTAVQRFLKIRSNSFERSLF